MAFCCFQPGTSFTVHVNLFPILWNLQQNYTASRKATWNIWHGTKEETSKMLYYNYVVLYCDIKLSKRFPE